MKGVKDRKMKVVGLTNYLIDLHSAKRSIGFIVLAAAITGLLGGFLRGGDALDGLIAALFFIAVPALLAGYLTSVISAPTLKRLNYRRSFYLAFFNSMILSVLYLSGVLMPDPIRGVLDILVYGYVIALIIRTFVLKVSYPYSVFQGIALGSVHPMIGYIMMLNAGILFPGVPMSIALLAAKIIAPLVIFLAGIALFVLLVNAPMKRNFGINTFEVLNAFLENWFDQSTTIEDVLKKIGEKADALVGMIAFRTKRGIKTLFVIPHVHPGPFGEVGGGKLTRVLIDRLERSTKLFILHGTATHDLNPITTSSLEKIADGIKRNLGSIEYYNTATHSVRAQSGEAKVVGQKFGRTLFMASTFSPEPTEDIDFSIGLAVTNQVKSNYDEVIYSDCHNCHKPGDHAIFSGDPMIFDLMDVARKLDAKIAGEKEYRVRLGIAIDPLQEYSYIDGIGPSGLRVTAIETNGQRTAYVLFDANNMVAGLRERIIKEIKKLGIDEVEVMTTDSHCVNSIRGVENPLGMKIRRDVLVKRAVQACKAAIADLEPVEVGAKMIRVKDIDVFGPQRSIELVSTVNTMIAIMKIVAPLIFMSALLLSLLSVFYIGW